MFGEKYEKQETEFKPIPKGRYSCILDNCCIEKTVTNGTNFLKMDCTIVDGDFSKRKLFHKIWFTEKAYNMAAQQLDNMGVFESLSPTTSIEDFMLASAEAVFKLVDKKLEVSVTGHQEHEGKKYEKTFVTGHGDTTDDVVRSTMQVDASEEIPF